MNQASPPTSLQRLINLRGKRVSQEMLSQLDLRQCLLGLSATSQMGILCLSLMLGILSGVVAAIAGSKLALDMVFDFQGWRYLTIAIVAIIVAAFVYWVQSQWLQSILVILVGCWLGLPILALVLRLVGLASPERLTLFVIGSPLIGTLLAAAAVLSVIGLSLASSLLNMGWQRQFRWLHGFLLTSFILVCGAMGLVNGVSGKTDTPRVQEIRSTQPMINSIMGLLGWLGSSILAVVIAIIILQFLHNRQSNAITNLGKAIANWGGTSFRELDLSKINFSGIFLANVDLRANKLYRTCFTDTTGWEAATVDDSYLDLHQPQVQALLSGKPTTENFRRTNLRGAYLRDAKLQDFDFTEANLDGADLRGANLRHARFVRTLVTNVDLSDADLTGCCLKDWSFNRQTCFQGVICDYIYREFEDGKVSQRYPVERNFLPGEFEAIVRKLETSYELVFEQEIDPISLGFVFEKFRLEDENLGLELQGLEQRGDLWIVKVGHKEGVSRSQVVERVNETYDDLRQLFESRYELALDAKEGEIARLNSYYQVLMDMYQQFLQKLVERTGGSTENVIIQGQDHQFYFKNQVGEIMENQNISASGNVDASTGAKITVGGDITGSTLNLGTITGQVNNLLQQLKDSPLQGSKNMSEILADLQTAIQQESTLPDDKKQEGLEAIVTLAEEAKKPPENRINKMCSLAVNAIKGIASTVSDASKLAEVVNTSLPIVKGLLGLV